LPEVLYFIVKIYSTSTLFAQESLLYRKLASTTSFFAQSYLRLIHSVLPLKSNGTKRRSYASMPHRDQINLAITCEVGWLSRFMNRRELINMPNIKPISDLRNYSKVLREVSAGAPVFLTKNGRGKYAIVDMQDYEKTQATLRLMNELAKGRKSGEHEVWLSPEDMRAHFRAKPDEV
jgi:prevent-host-death family protein